MTDFARWLSPIVCILCLGAGTGNFIIGTLGALSVIPATHAQAGLHLAVSALFFIAAGANRS